LPTPILDWLDADAAPREYGAEADYYGGLSPPITPRNGPIGDLDELLQVRGVTPELLYGVDRNHNMFVDADEQPRGAMTTVDNAEGAMNRGWAAYLTITSVESIGGSPTTPMIDLNDPNLQTLFDTLKTNQLSDEQAKFIILFQAVRSASGRRRRSARRPTGRWRRGRRRRGCSNRHARDANRQNWDRGRRRRWGRRRQTRGQRGGEPRVCFHNHD
jgi:hypothetical protein